MKNKDEKISGNYTRCLKTLKPCIKIKGIIMSEDNGKTWCLYRQDYISHANDAFGQFDFAQKSLEGLSLKTDENY
jgi:hypothetical protein